MMPVDGLISSASQFSLQETLERYLAVLTDLRMQIFARIDHAAGAREAGLDLRPTLLVIFGNPAVGTYLMQERQSAGIDLPLKALIWEDQQGTTWLSYNDPVAFLARHEFGANNRKRLEAMSVALAAAARQATTGDA
jgi:uncharacterized protein (DUF302 family)